MGKTSRDEQIAKALVDNAINDGFLISVNGKEKVVNRSRNIAEITKGMFSTNMDTLTLSVEERRVGTITLIYGNGRNGLDVIGDHTDIPHINRLIEHTMKEFERSSTANLQGPARAATSGEVKDLRRASTALKEVVADLTLENRLLKKSLNGDGEDEA